MGTFVIYTRVSKDHDGTSTSPAAQYDECMALAQRHEWGSGAIEHVSDVDHSAWDRRRNRPGFDGVVGGIRGGSVDGLVVHHLDRLLRQSRELEHLIDAIESRTRGKFPIYSVHGDLDLSTPDGRFQARILTSVAQKESDDKSRRLKLVLGKNARDGKVHGGITPYGWLPGQTAVSVDEAAVIREAVTQVMDGVGLNQIARDLNARGTPTRKGGRWHATTLKQILTNPRLAGLRTHHGVVVADGDWERIITPDVHYKLVELLDSPAHPNHHTRLTYWLTGMIHCGVCGHAMRSRAEGGKGRKYVCRRDMGGCGTLIDAPRLEEVAATIITGLIREHGIGPRPQDDDVAGAEEEQRRIEERLANLSRDFYVHQRITEGEFIAARDPLAQQLEHLRVQVRSLARTKEATPQLCWDDLVASERADLAAEILERIVIHRAVPGRRFDPSRVDVWLRSDVGRA